MTTNEVANAWANYCKSGQWDKAQEELYDVQCMSIEMEGAPGVPFKTEGIEAIKMKGQQWNQMVEAFHGVEIEGPMVAGDHFAAIMKMDVTMKGQPRRIDEEVAVFQVKGGKIVVERFFYPIG